jgi:preprotein translocase SecF subunit
MFRLFDPKTPWDFVSKVSMAVKLGIGLAVTSLVLLFTLGINWGIDFSGGTEMQVKFSKEVSSGDIRGVLDKAGFEKKQVQRYGAPDNHEMLLRVERITSIKDEDVQRIEKLIRDSWGNLSFGSEGAPDAVKVSFSKQEGDRITVHMPVPKAKGPAPKNLDPAAIDAALISNLGPADAEDKKALDDAAIDALSGAGFDRSAVAARAREAGYAVTAAPDKLAEANFNEALENDRLLDQQQDVLAKLLEEKSGYQLRRTKKTGEDVASTEDAIQRDEPYKGQVKYLVHFLGVSIEIEKALSAQFGEVEVRRVDFVDAAVAEQLRTDGLLAVLLALFAILVYIAVRFDIFFSPGAILALVHDSVVALAVFPLTRIEFDLPSIAAVLTVVGYSINNTIVIYDRIREVMPGEEKGRLSEEDVRTHVNQAINDTFSRTINTTLTTLFASIALWVFAGGVVQNFAIVLSAGIVLGAFSSTLLAPASYLYFRKNFHKAPAEKKQKKGLSREDKARGVV